MSAVAELERFFAQAEDAFAAAVRRAGLDARPVRVAGSVAELRFAGPAMLQPVWPALAHLSAPAAGEPALRVAIWDTASTGVALRPPPWDDVAYRERGNVRLYHDARFSLAFDRRTHVFSALDADRGRAVYWVQDATWLPVFEAAAPLRLLWQSWLQHRGMFVVHASAVAGSGGGVLLAGRSGSGKSTTAVLCMRAGFAYAGDDFVVVSPQPTPFAYGLYGCARLGASLGWMADLAPRVSNADRLDTEKPLLFWAEDDGCLAGDGFPLRAVALPHVAATAETRFARIRPEAAFRAIVPDTVLRSLGNAELVFAGMKRLVQALPCYALSLGTSRAEIPGAVHRLLADA